MSTRMCSFELRAGGTLVHGVYNGKPFETSR
ncbi:hypothetical protein CBM2585_A10080 [Cupriavidus taiwanensis]|nr:hypothetical protein CBM2585_A10080 [Cupriavidus taiwanensis]